MKRRILALLLSIASAFTCAFGLSACGGNGGLSIKGASINAEGELVLTLADDSTLNLGKVTGNDGKDGNDGKEGVGVSNAYFDEDGNLVVKLTNGKEVICGNIVDNSSSYGLYYSEVRENGKVTGYEINSIGIAEDTDIIIPALHRGKPVVGIADNAFSGAKHLTSVTIPDSITYIGEYAFYNCTDIKSVTIGKGVKSSGKFAFGKCPSLESVYISDVAGWCGIQFENAPATPLYFAHKLYVNNELATNIEIPDSATQVGDFAFYEVDNIQSVNIGNGAKRIGESAFLGCLNLKSVTVGNGVTQIADSAFACCEKLENAAFGGSVQNIANHAFYQCYQLKEIELPVKTKTIGESAFAECSSLKSATLNEGLESIGDNAFSLCSSLKSLKIPSSVTQLGFGVLMFGGGGGFEGLNADNSIEEIVLSENLTQIPEFAFSGCNISTVEIPDKVTKINYSSFYGCSALKSIVIPTSVKSIVSYAFYNCNSIKSVYYKGSAEEWAKISIGKKGNNITDESVTVYYYSQTAPVSQGNYWRYVEGKPVVWEQ